MRRKYAAALLLALCVCFGAATSAQAVSPAAERIVQQDKGKGSSGKGKAAPAKERDVSDVAKSVAAVLAVGAIAGGAVALSRRRSASGAAQRASARRAAVTPTYSAAGDYYRPARRGERSGQLPEYMQAQAAPQPTTSEPPQRELQSVVRTDAEPFKASPPPASQKPPVSAWEQSCESPFAAQTPAQKPPTPMEKPAPVYPTMADRPFAAFDEQLPLTQELFSQQDKWDDYKDSTNK